MLIWNFPGYGPANLPGQMFVAATGTAVTFSAGLALSYAGLMLINPATVAGTAPKKLVPLRAIFAPTGTGVAPSCPWGMIKAIGTCTAGAASGFSGIVTTPGMYGTSTPIAVVAGTASFLNGTTGAVPNGPNWVQYCGVLPVGTATYYAGGVTTVDLIGEVSVMPGEAMAIAPNVAAVGMASIAWLEIPLNSGA